MDNEGISDGNRKVEIRVGKNGRKDKVIIEKSAAQGLPQGWIKKLVISNRTGRKVRRDPFFIDPKSVYIFQSFKDASRYVETGKVGSYARKLKESDIEDDDSGSGKTVLPLESVEMIPADDLLEKEEKINVYVRSSKWRSLASSVENQHVAKRVTRSQAKANKNEEDLDLKRTNMSSSNAKDIVKARSSNASLQNPEKGDSTETQITRSKAKVKKNMVSDSVVRRASKRLAGIELEPTPELKTRTKAQRVVPSDVGTASKCKQTVATGGLEKKDIDIPLNKEVAKSDNEHSSPKPNAAATNIDCVSAEMEVQIEKMSKPVGRNGFGDEKKMKMPLVMISEAELNPVFRLDGYKPKEEMSPVSPLCEKTAARKRIGRSSPKTKRASAKGTGISALGLSNKGEHPCDKGNAIDRRDSLGSDSWEEMEKKSNGFSSAFDSTLADMWKDPCIAFAIKTLTGESLHLPSTAAISGDPQKNNTGVAFCPETSTYAGADIWKDPCIDFAIKTLTGAIPIGLDEADVKSKSEGTRTTAATQEQEGRQSRCDELVIMENKTG